MIRIISKNTTNNLSYNFKNYYYLTLLFLNIFYLIFIILGHLIVSTN